MVDFAHISQCVYEGDTDQVKRLVREAQAQGHGLMEIWSEGLIEGIAVAGEDMKHGILSQEEMIAASKAMAAGLSALRGWRSMEDPAKALEEYRRNRR